MAPSTTSKTTMASGVIYPPIFYLWDPTNILPGGALCNSREGCGNRFAAAITLNFAASPFLHPRLPVCPSAIVAKSLLRRPRVPVIFLPLLSERLGTGD